MKTLKFDTKKGIFIMVDMPLVTKHLELARDINGTHICWHDGNADLVRDDFEHGMILLSDNPSEKYKVIGKYSKITEELAKNIVDDVWGKYKNYKTTEPVGNYKRLVCDTALESLQTLINVLDINLYNNPEKSNHFDPEDYNHEQYIKVMDAEVLTFYNPYIIELMN